VNKLCLKFSIVDIFSGCQESEICTATKLCKLIRMVWDGSLCMRPCNFEDRWTAGLGHIYNLWSMMLMRMSITIPQNWCNFSHDSFNKICNEYSHLRIIILQTICGGHFVPLKEFCPHQNNYRRSVFLILNSPNNTPQTITWTSLHAPNWI